MTSRLEFQDENELCCESTSKRLEAKTKRLLNEKRKHLKSFQLELDELWKICFASDEDITEFYDALESFIDDKECILDHYESSVRYWRNHQVRNSTLLDKIKEWQGLFNDKFKIKMRKELSLQIQQLVEEFYIKEKRPFLIHGVSWQEFSCQQQQEANVLPKDK